MSQNDVNAGAPNGGAVERLRHRNNILRRKC